LPDTPDRAAFYTSRRTSNEAAFVYQLMIRCFGTNNMPDCSNMCHESSGAALQENIGIGKGSVSVPDLEHADLILIAGQNPGTNHPRMLSVLEKAKANGAKVIAINPLPEAGLLRFKDPQKVHGVIGDDLAIADEFLQIRVGGDQALFQGLGKLLLEAEDRHPGAVLDRSFIDEHCAGFDAYAAHIRAVDLNTVAAATGLSRAQLDATAQALIRSSKTIVCRARALTQQTQGVATIQDSMNLLLLQGMIGKPCAGVCPVRGNSNVQGDRTTGIWEKMPESFLAALDAEFGITIPGATATTPSTPSAQCATDGSRFSWRWAVTSSAPPPTPRSPKPCCATARSPCKCR
jgi:molybdopterin-dependent oxidoreductase alpha subunit